jgi:hypothetical protein
MKTMLILITAALVSLAGPATAQLKDTEIKVQRRTLERQDKIARPKQNAYELTRGLRLTVKNTGSKAAVEGEIEWAILVERPGMQKALLDSGKEKLQVLKAGEEVSMDVGSIAVQDIAGSRQEMEYHVLVRRNGLEVAKAESTPKFNQLAESARGAKKREKEQKKATGQENPGGKPAPAAAGKERKSDRR